MTMEWRAATILFADVKGYSSLTDTQMKTFSEVILPELAQRINGCDLIERNTWGDGIVLLGAQAAHVCEAALHMRDMFAGLNWRRYNLPKLDVRISIHHGEYVQGQDALTGKISFCGRTVVTAARLEPVTPPGHIWITDRAASVLTDYMQAEGDDFFAIDPIGNITLPKKYGSLSISVLRRKADAALSEAERAKVFEAEKMRVNVGRILDRDKDIEELIAEQRNFVHEVVIGVLVTNGRVLLVRRRDKAEGLDWMFPSARKWATDDPVAVIEKEVFNETGVVCSVIEKITEINQHPITGHRCQVFALESEMDDLQAAVSNRDTIENEAVELVPISQARERIGAGLNQDIEAFLERGT